MNYAMKKSEKVFQAFTYILFILLAISAVYPFINAIALAFNQGYDSLRGGIYLWPRMPTLENFMAVFSNKDILRGAYISVFRTVVGTAVHIILCGMCAFALSKKYLPGRKLFITFLFIPMVFSGGIIPFYILLRNLHLTNTIWVYVLPYIYSFFNIVIMRTYFESLPDEVEEAAIIDGCGYLRLFLRIVVPLSLPIMATVALYMAVSHWNDWFVGQFYVTKKSLYPLQTILVKFLKENEANDVLSRLGVKTAGVSSKQSFTTESLKMAVLVVVTFPILCSYPFLQKYFIKGVLIGSVKG